MKDGALPLLLLLLMLEPPLLPFRSATVVNLKQQRKKIYRHRHCQRRMPLMELLSELMHVVGVVVVVVACVIGARRSNDQVRRHRFW
ncbi:hypothetical protein PIB30_106033, partial [Stylosanthes scabra]|nr:hypothetical protein [Stylosanthes scabra]